MNYDGIFAPWMSLSLVYFSQCCVGIFLIIVTCFLSILYSFSVHELIIIFVFCHRWSLREFSSCLCQFKIAASWDLTVAQLQGCAVFQRRCEWWCPVSRQQLRGSLGFQDLAVLPCYSRCPFPVSVFFLCVCILSVCVFCLSPSFPIGPLRIYYGFQFSVLMVFLSMWMRDLCIFICVFSFVLSLFLFCPILMLVF